MHLIQRPARANNRHRSFFQHHVLATICFIVRSPTFTSVHANNSDTVRQNQSSIHMQSYLVAKADALADAFATPTRRGFGG